MAPRRSASLLDVVLTIALSALSFAAFASRDDRPGGSLAVVLVVMAVAPVALRQRAPVLTLLAIAAALIGYSVLGYGEWPSGALGLVVAVFTVATLRPPVYGLVVLPVVAAAVLVLKLANANVTWPIALQAVLVCLIAWVVGDGTRRWARRAEAAAAESARLVAQERIRIARELHDVVAHHMSVVALQAGVAEYVLEADPATARRALGDAGSASRAALQEMGRLLDALRTDEGPSDFSPQPGLAQVEGLAERLRGVGLDVRVLWEGERRDLGAGLELCVYRVVQESLTNALRHAGRGSAATVTVRYDAADLVVEIVDDGSGSAVTVGGAGRGIAGMRERVELYGGELIAGPRRGGGFRVALRLPYAARQPAPLDPTVRAARS